MARTRCPVTDTKMRWEHWLDYIGFLEFVPHPPRQDDMDRVIRNLETMWWKPSWGNLRTRFDRRRAKRNRLVLKRVDQNPICGIDMLLSNCPDRSVLELE